MQFDYNTVNLTEQIYALASQSCGSTPPPNPLEYQLWMDTSAVNGTDGHVALKIRINNEWVPLLVNSVDLPLLPFDHRNLIINGEMRVDQRFEGAVIPMTHAEFGLDRWLMSLNNAGGSVEVRRVHTDKDSAPFLAGLTHAQQLKAPTALVVGTQNSCAISQWIEAQFCTNLAYGRADARTASISFWVKSPKQGRHPFRAAFHTKTGGLEYYLTSYNVTTANVWELISLQVPGNTVSEMAQGNQAGFHVLFSAMLERGLSADPAYVPAWGLAANITSNFEPFNAFDQNNQTFEITGIKVEVSPFSTPLEIPLYDETLARCQRYFEKTFQQGDRVPSSDPMIPDTRSTGGSLHGGNRRSGTYWEPTAVWAMKVSKRVVPTVTLYRAGLLGTEGQWWGNGGVSSSNARHVNAGHDTINFDNDDFEVASSLGQLFIHATADAEIITS